MMDNQQLRTQIQALLERQDDGLRDTAPLQPVSQAECQQYYQAMMSRFEMATDQQEQAYLATELLVCAAEVDEQTMQRALEQIECVGIGQEQIVAATLALLEKQVQNHAFYDDWRACPFVWQELQRNAHAV
jgi:hypothetical protein